MKNRIKGMMDRDGDTVLHLSEKLNIDLSLLRRLVENQEQPVPLDIAEQLASHYGYPLKFVLGHPFNCKRKLDEFPEDIRNDINNLHGSYRDCVIFKKCEGYFESHDDISLGVGFIAMSFAFEEHQELNIIRECFEKSIINSYHTPKIMIGNDSNGFIPLDIMEEIKKSKFLVMDTTYENYGAYFEAGYAKGLGKEIIICCKKSVFDKKPDHFDIRQLNHILWENEADFIEQLTRRIKNTIAQV